MAEMHEQAERDYMLGMKYKDIAEKYSVALPTVKSWKTRYKWNRAEKATRTKANKSMHTKKVCKGENKLPLKLELNNRYKDELTEKQKLFCLFFVNNRNATQAAIRAGYSKDTATEIGYENLTKPHIRAEVDRLKNLKRQSIMLEPDDIVERYMRIAFADMTDIAEWGTELVPDIDNAGCMQIGKDGSVKMRKYNYMDFKDHDQVDGGLVCEISFGKSGMKVKLEDRQKALSWLSDYFNMNPMNQHKQWYDKQKLQIDRDNLDLRKDAEDKRNW